MISIVGWLPASLMVALALAPQSRVSAQRAESEQAPTVAGWGALDGNVVDTTGAALIGVEVVPLDAPRLAVRSRAGGAFRIDSLPSGLHLIRFRRVGLAPITIPVTILRNDVVSADVVLGQLAFQLRSVVIQGENGEISHLPFGVADRVRNAPGRYITAGDIKRMHVIETPDIFRRVAGLEVIGPPGRKAVVTTRGASAVWVQPNDAGKQALGSNCSEGLRVFIDGAGADEVPSGAPVRAGGNLNSIAPSDIALIEVYKDAVEIPASLPQSPCGAIFIWTK